MCYPGGDDVEAGGALRLINCWKDFLRGVTRTSHRAFGGSRPSAPTRLRLGALRSKVPGSYTSRPIENPHLADEVPHSKEDSICIMSFNVESPANHLGTEAKALPARPLSK